MRAPSARVCFNDSVRALSAAQRTRERARATARGGMGAGCGSRRHGRGRSTCGGTGAGAAHAVARKHTWRAPGLRARACVPQRSVRAPRQRRVPSPPAVTADSSLSMNYCRLRQPLHRRPRAPPRALRQALRQHRCAPLRSRAAAPQLLVSGASRSVPESHSRPRRQLPASALRHRLQGSSMSLNDSQKGEDVASARSRTPMALFSAP